MKPRFLCAGVMASLGILFDVQKVMCADLIITAGDIVTVNELQPQAEAVAVKCGRIVAVGYRDEVMKLRQPNTKVIDLGGKTLVPGFVDAHGHAFSCGIQAIAANLFAAPDGGVKDIASLQNTLRQWAKADSARKFDGWIYGTGYDDSQLKEHHRAGRQVKSVGGRRVDLACRNWRPEDRHRVVPERQVRRDVYEITVRGPVVQEPLPHRWRQAQPGWFAAGQDGMAHQALLQGAARTTEGLCRLPGLEG